MLRAIFWILVVISLIGALVAVSLFHERTFGEAGMAFIFFLPASVLSVVLGIGAILLRKAKADAFTPVERWAGNILGVFLAVGSGAVVLVLALNL